MPQDLFNFRDLGGLETHCSRKVRHGHLYRVGNLGDVNHSSAEYLATHKNIGTYIDFRTADEVEKFGSPRPLLDRGVRWERLYIDTHDEKFSPLARPLPEDWLGLYVRVFERNVKEWLRFLQIVKEAPHAVIYGCVFGKDRTGIATSMLLNQLNVRDDQIFLDYSKTTQGLYPHYVRLKSIWEKSPLTHEEQHKHFFSTPQEIIEGFLKAYRSRAATDLKHILDEIGGSQKKELQQKLLEPT
jgi:protein-tyrosine phosphatase